MNKACFFLILSLLYVIGIRLPGCGKGSNSESQTKVNKVNKSRP